MPTPGTVRYSLDASVRRLDGGRVLLGGSPLRLFRLTDAGTRCVDDLAGGGDIDVTGAAGRLVERLVEAGALHPRPEPRPDLVQEVTVVIPTRDRDVTTTIDALGPCGGIVVVDDGSRTPVSAGSAGVVVRRSVAGGPAVARNDGLAEVTTPWVAFMDSDVVPRAGWLAASLGHADDPRIAVVAPRVASAAGPGWLSRYEAGRSPLDLGDRPAPIVAGTRVSYVPAAALLCRTDVVRAVGGFDVALTTGEDVDLVWRLAAAGWRCRYEPSAVVDHEPRASVRAFAEQRRGYGRSAGPLALRHNGALAPVRMNAWSAATWAVAVLGSVPAGVALGAATAALAARGEVLPPRDAVALATRGHLGAGRTLGAAAARAWWPAAVALTVVSRRARLAMAVAAVGLPLADWFRERPPLDPARYVLLRIVDDLAYGLGVWEGSWGARTIAPLLPHLTLSPPWARRRRLAGTGTARGSGT
jgi:mycofactocin glycosyltransferase